MALQDVIVLLPMVLLVLIASVPYTFAMPAAVGRLYDVSIMWSGQEHYDAVLSTQEYQISGDYNRFVSPPSFLSPRSVSTILDRASEGTASLSVASPTLAIPVLSFLLVSLGYVGYRIRRWRIGFKKRSSSHFDGVELLPTTSATPAPYAPTSPKPQPFLPLISRPPRDIGSMNGKLHPEVNRSFRIGRSRSLDLTSSIVRPVTAGPAPLREHANPGRLVQSRPNTPVHAREGVLVDLSVPTALDTAVLSHPWTTPNSSSSSYAAPRRAPMSPRFRPSASTSSSRSKDDGSEDITQSLEQRLRQPVIPVSQNIFMDRKDPNEGILVDVSLPRDKDKEDGDTTRFESSSVINESHTLVDVSDMVQEIKLSPVPSSNAKGFSDPWLDAVDVERDWHLDSAAVTPSSSVHQFEVSREDDAMDVATSIVTSTWTWTFGNSAEDIAGDGRPLQQVDDPKPVTSETDVTPRFTVPLPASMENLSPLAEGQPNEDAADVLPGLGSASVFTECQEAFSPPPSAVCYQDSTDHVVTGLDAAPETKGLDNSPLSDTSPSSGSYLPSNIELSRDMENADSSRITPAIDGIEEHTTMPDLQSSFDSSPEVIGAEDVPTSPALSSSSSEADDDLVFSESDDEDVHHGAHIQGLAITSTKQSVLLTLTPKPSPIEELPGVAPIVSNDSNDIRHEVSRLEHQHNSPTNPGLLDSRFNDVLEQSIDCEDSMPQADVEPSSPSEEQHVADDQANKQVVLYAPALRRPAWSLRAADAPPLGLKSGTQSTVKSASEAETRAITTGKIKAKTSGSDSSLPGTFPAEQEVSVTATASTGAVTVSSTQSSRRTARSPIDIALAMQLRPGLGLGADPAWMVRFLMSMFGWFVVLLSGTGSYERFSPMT